MGLFDALDISAQRPLAERLRMDVTSENLANAQTPAPTASRTAARTSSCSEPAAAASPASLGKAMRRVRRRRPRGVAGRRDRRRTSAEQRRVYDPGHPDADAQGYVTMPNVNPSPR